jgi:MGT family glycosyltransferase
MARLLFATVPIAGHVHPLVGIARALCARGHELRWYTGAKYKRTVECAGARHDAYQHARDFDDHFMERAFPLRSRHAGLQQLKHDLQHVFADQALGQLADIESIASEFAPHVIIADPCMLGALLFKERTGTPLIFINVVASPVRSRDTAPFGLGILPSTSWIGPWRNLALNALVDRVLFRELQAHWVKLRREAGLTTRRVLFDATLDASLFLQPTVAGFEYPRSDLPEHVKLVGALHADPPVGLERAAFFDEIRPDTKVVHVTQGTMSNVRPELIAPALLGLADEPVLVVVATGGRTASELGLTRVPGNARIVPFVSYPELLPKTSVMVTNGGYGGVQMALAHGVPLVVWGTTEDKPEVAARVAWAGVGLRLSRLRPPSASAVRTAVRTLLLEPRYQKRARELAAEYAATDGVTKVVALTEELLQQAQPAAGGPRAASVRAAPR